MPVPPTRRAYRLADKLAENQHITVRILHLELPVAVRLLSERQNDLDPVLERFVELLNTFHSDVSVPHSARSLFVEVGLFITGNSLKHDLDGVAVDNSEDVRRRLR